MKAYCHLALAIAGAAILTLPAQAAQPWTLKAIVEAPKVVQTAISADGTAAIYLARQDHLDANVRDSSLVQVDVNTGASRVLLTANWISKIKQIPGQDAWSLLADVGDGVQLYKLDRVGMRTPLVVRTSTVNIGGEASTSVFPSSSEPRIAYGVLDYGWSSDGKALWYSCAMNAETESPTSPFVDNPTVPKVRYHANRSELHVVNMSTGRDDVVASAAGDPDWPPVFYAWNAADWSVSPSAALVLNYRVPVATGGGHDTPADWHYDFATGMSGGGRIDAPVPWSGPNGGRLETKGFWAQRHLVEHMPNGKTHDYGGVNFAISGTWNPGLWRVADQAATIAAVRFDGLNVRNGLVKVAADGTAAELGGAISLDECAFTPDASVGVCIREGLSTPPALVAIDGHRWVERRLVAIDPTYDGIAPLKYEARVWTAGGHSASGFVLYPRRFKTGQRYPAILITHGNDGDNRFVNTDFQWSYPVQAFAEAGYFVVYVNDISWYESVHRQEVLAQWAAGEGTLTGRELKQSLWLDDMAIYREAMGELTEAGLIDPARTGIVGYSRGAQMVAVAVTQMDIFKAASSGEGSMFAPSSYWMGDNYKIYGMLFGGDPFDDKWRNAWESFSPAYRASKVRSAVLFQMVNLGAGTADFHQALRANKVPTDYAIFPGDTHLPNLPSNRLEIMQENLDWFAYWFGWEGEPKTAPRDQYLSWRKMRSDGHGSRAMY